MPAYFQTKKLIIFKNIHVQKTRSGIHPLFTSLSCLCLSVISNSTQSGDFVEVNLSVKKIASADGQSSEQEWGISSFCGTMNYIHTQRHVWADSGAWCRLLRQLLSGNGGYCTVMWTITCRCLWSNQRAV